MHATRCVPIVALAAEQVVARTDPSAGSYVQVMTGACIRIERDATPRSDLFRAYKVAVDGGVVGGVKRGESLTHETAPGHHTLHFTIDWASSPSVEFDIAEGQEVVIRCRPNVNPLRALYWMTIGRGRWIGVEIIGCADSCALPPVSAARSGERDHR